MRAGGDGKARGGVTEIVRRHPRELGIVSRKLGNPPGRIVVGGTGRFVVLRPSVQ